MRILSVFASKNTNKPDATGAFIPQSTVFAQTRKAAGDTVTTVPFDNLLPPPIRRMAFRSILQDADPYDALIYFGHGTRRGLPSAGFDRASLDSLLDAIHVKAAANLIVTLYACSTAATPVASGIDGDGGYADLMRDGLSLRGHKGWLDAHTVAGHTTINRYTRRFYMDGQSVGTGGTWLIAPGSPEWKAWGEALKDDRALRFGFPFMTEKQLHDRLPG